MAECPIEKMDVAYWQEWDQWGYRLNKSRWEIYRGDPHENTHVIIQETDDGRQASQLMENLAGSAAMRAALRALAEMPPTEKMKYAASRLTLGGNVIGFVPEAQAYLLAAAEEGETP